jgi:DNA polymerase-3 subunit epsilon
LKRWFSRKGTSARLFRGIDAGMLRDATTFADVAQHIASRVDGAIVAGHNVGFDMRMGGNEFNAPASTSTGAAGLDTLAPPAANWSRPAAN